MISAWWLFLIVPLAASVGMLVTCLCVMAKSEYPDISKEE
jgi:hypothetical protein